MLNYEMKLYQIKATDGVYWVAEHPAVTGVLGTSKYTGSNNDILEAIEDLRVNLAFHLESMKLIGLAIPKEDGVKF